jgi:phage terminase Nu1 subunit (DNA packaging protein)
MKSVGTPPLSGRKINWSQQLDKRGRRVIKRDGKLDEQAWVAYANLLLSDEGQQLVKQAGFVSIR